MYGLDEDAVTVMLYMCKSGAAANRVLTELSITYHVVLDDALTLHKERFPAKVADSNPMRPDPL